MQVWGLTSLFSFTGWRVASIHVSPAIVQVQLVRDGRRRLRCPHCGAKVRGTHEDSRMVSDMPLGQALRVVIQYPAVRARCGECGFHSWISPPEIDPHRRVT